MREKRHHLYKTFRVHPLMLFALPAIQVPLFLTFSMSLRDLSGLSPLPGFGTPTTLTKVYEELDSEGLTDSYAWHTLPLVLGSVHMANTLFLKNVSRVVWVIRALALLSIPAAASLPKSVSLYWFTSASYSLVQYMVLKHPLIRRVLKLH
jgi:inner membrane protein COX18